MRWTENGPCKDLTFFYIVSSFVNVDIPEGYFADSLKALGIEEFKVPFFLENQFEERRKILR
jgi:hypothetical protein